MISDTTGSFDPSPPSLAAFERVLDRWRPLPRSWWSPAARLLERLVCVARSRSVSQGPVSNWRMARQYVEVHRHLPPWKLSVEFRALEKLLELLEGKGMYR